MPDGWKATAPDHGNGVHLVGPDAVRLHVGHVPAYGGAGARFEIKGSPTREESGQTLRYSDAREFEGGGRKSITVAASKKPGAIARDITNRLLPAYLPYVAALRKRLVEHMAYEDRVVRFRDQLLSALGNAGQRDRDDRSNDIRLNLEDGYGTIQVQDGSIHLSNMSIPGDLALEIATAMAKYGRKN
jgi:hypothetical protein